MYFYSVLKKASLALGLDVKRSISQSSLESHLIALFRLYNINLVIDVGANAGQYGQMLRSIGYRGQILSFEPLRAPFEKLISISRRDPKWCAINVALGDKVEKKSINIYSSSVFSSMLQMNEFGREKYSGHGNVESQSIEIDTLDNKIKSIDHFKDKNIFLKMDTQGYDLKVLAGAKETLNQCYGLQSEVSFKQIYDGMPTYRESLDVFEAEKFMVSGMFPVSRNSDFSIIEADFVLVRNSSDH